MSDWMLLAIVLGPMLLVGAGFGAYDHGWRGVVTMPLQLVAGLGALVAAGLFLHHIL